MEKLRTFWFLSVLCLTGLNSALTQGEETYFVVGGILKLRPRVSKAFTNIVWKHKLNMVAEWVKDKLDEVYKPFEGRTFLDKTTGSLEIKNMTEADAGLYTVEINRKVRGQLYNAIAIVEVPKPSAVVRPLTCSHNSHSCTLSCDGETKGAEPVTYSWKMGGGDWEQSERERVITKAKDAHVEKFYCRMKNPVSVKESEPEKNPFFKRKEPSNTGGIIAAVIIVLILIAAVIIFVLWKFGLICSKGSVDPEGGKDATPSELARLTETEGQHNSSPGNGAPDGRTVTDAHTTKETAEPGGDPPTEPPATSAGNHTSAAADDTHASPSGPEGGAPGGDPPTQPMATPAGDHNSAAADDTHTSPSEPEGGASGGDPPTQPTATPAGDHTPADGAQSSPPEAPDGKPEGESSNNGSTKL